jgi:hypothetical protein
MHVHLCGYIEDILLYIHKKSLDVLMAATKSIVVLVIMCCILESPMFQRKIFPPSSGSKSKLSQKSAQLANTTCWFHSSTLNMGVKCSPETLGSLLDITTQKSNSKFY